MTCVLEWSSRFSMTNQIIEGIDDRKRCYYYCHNIILICLLYYLQERVRRRVVSSPCIISSTSSPWTIEKNEDMHFKIKLTMKVQVASPSTPPPTISLMKRINFSAKLTLLMFILSIAIKLNKQTYFFVSKNDVASVAQWEGADVDQLEQEKRQTDLVEVDVIEARRTCDRDTVWHYITRESHFTNVAIDRKI